MRNVFFFHVHALIIKKMGGAMGDLHDGPPFIVFCEKDLTCMSNRQTKFKDTKNIG